MQKLITAFLLFFVFNVIAGGIMEGGGGVSATVLTQDMTAVTTTMHVSNTQGFLRADHCYIDNEDIRYVSKTATTITVATTGRGYSNTVATTHSAGTMVYTPQASIINGALGFNVAATDTTVGKINVIVMFWNFAWKTVPKLLTWDFPQYRLNEWVQYIRIVLVIFSAGLTFYVAYMLLTSWGTIVPGIFRVP